jgi:hypothetical protein
MLTVPSPFHNYFSNQASTMLFMYSALGSTTVGQNLAGGQPNWTVAVQSWWDEIQLWKYGPEPETYLGNNGSLLVGHFTQVHWSNKIYIKFTNTQ